MTLSNHAVAFKQQQANKPISRRTLLGILATGAGVAASAYSAKQIVDILSELPEEDVYAVAVKEARIIHNKGQPFNHTDNVTYLEFRDTVFRLYPLQAGKNDNPAKLIRKAHSRYDPNDNLDPDLVLRAEDLFNLVNTKKINLNDIVNNGIKTFRAKVPATPIVRENITYQIPVKTGYASLEEALSAYKR